MGDAVEERGRERIVLGPFALIKGWFIAVTVWVGTLCVLLVGQELLSAASPERDGNYIPAMALAVLFWGYMVGLVVAGPLGWALAFLLRPVRKQWLHVAAFFAVPTVLFWVLGALLGFGWSVGLLGLWATVGAASALGRFAVRKDVDLVRPVTGGGLRTV